MLGTNLARMWNCSDYNCAENKVLQRKLEKAEDNIKILQQRNFSSEIGNSKKCKYIKYLQKDICYLNNELRKMKRSISSNKATTSILKKAEEKAWYWETESNELRKSN